MLTVAPSAVLLAVLAIVAAPARTAQPAQKTVSAVVVLKPDLARADLPFAIQRRAAQTPHDIILLPPGADEKTASVAIRALLTARLVHGDVPKVTESVRLQAKAVREGSSHPPFPYAAAMMRELRSAQLTHVPGIGNVKAVVVWLPAQAAARRRR